MAAQSDAEPRQVPPAPPRVLQKQKRLTPEQVDEVVAGYEDGQSVVYLAEVFGCHRVTIANVLERRGVTLRPKLTDPESLNEATRLYLSGMSLTKAGAVVGVTANTIRNHLKSANLAISGRHAKIRVRNQRIPSGTSSPR